MNVCANVAKLRDSGRIGRIGVTVALVASLIQIVALSAHTADGGRAPRMPVPHDWSHRHLVFSAPSSVKHAERLQQDNRYRHQLLWRNASSLHRVNSPKSNVTSNVYVPPIGALVGRADSAMGLISSSPTEGVPPQLVSSSPTEGVGNSLHRDWGMSLGAGATGGDEMFAAKFSFDVNAVPSCANDFVVFNTSLAGSTTKPSIVAFNQLYSTQGVVGGLCNQNGPSVMWSYSTNPAGDTTGTNVTSPVLSLDGTQVVYVETRTNLNGGAILHILRWQAGQGTIAAPAAPNQIVTDWATCVAGNSCIVNITFNGAQPDTNSAPFYDYSRDALYVGDNAGVLHKFTPVLTGVPAEVVNGSWPITVNAAVLSSPVFDNGSGNIFVGDSTGLLSYVLDVTSIVGFCAVGVAPCLGTPSQALGGAIFDAPLVDSSTGRVFAFDGTDANHGSVYQFDTGLSVASQVTVKVGSNSATTSKLHSGAFDNTYMTSVNGTGYLLVCGKDSGFNDRPTIHRITITAGIMNSVSDGFLRLVTTSQEECSPVTEVFNSATNTDWIYFSVGRYANQTAAGCSATAGIQGCLMALNMTALGGAWPPAAVSNGYPLPTGTSYGASTSGIVVDNVADPTLYPQASSIYFTFVKNSVAAATCNGTAGVGCAVKLTQSGLQ